jgi:hypothetical protein
MHPKQLADDLRAIQTIEAVLTAEQKREVKLAQDELQRNIQQMLSSGNYAFGAVRLAMANILEGWK